MMSLKKFLKSCIGILTTKKESCVCSIHLPLRSLWYCSGQAITEYFILLVLLAAITVIGSSAFFSKMRDSVQNFEGNCFNAMGQEGTDPADWSDENPWWNVLRPEEGGDESLGEDSVIASGSSNPGMNW